MDKKRSSLWCNRDYLLLWSGQALSTLGDTVQTLTLPLLILTLTHSAAQAGIAGSLEALPFPLLSLPVGVLVDRWDRKRVMIICDAGRVILIGSIPLVFWLGHLTLWQIFLVALTSGIFATFFSLAETASLPNVVRKEHLPEAMGQNYATSIASGIIGPPVGGFLYTLNPALPFLTNAFSYVLSVLSLGSIRVKFQQKRQNAVRNFRKEMSEGLRWTWQHPFVRFLAMRVGAGNLVYGGSTLLVIVLATQQHASPVAISIIFTIDSLGGIVASLLVKWVQQHFSLAQIAISLGWITALLFPLYVVAPNVIVLGLISAALSFILVLFDVTQLSYRTTLIPDEIFGRVTSSIRLLTVGSLSLGAALTGILLQTIGSCFTILAFTGYLFLLALVTTINRDVRYRGAKSETRIASEEETAS